MVKWGLFVITIGCFFIILGGFPEGTPGALPLLIGVTNGLAFIVIGSLLVWKGNKNDKEKKKNKK